MEKSADKFSWLILGCVSLIALFLYILFQSISPLIPVLIKEFELSHSMAGFLYSLPILMIAFFSYPLGILSDRIGMEVAVGFGASLAILSSFVRPLCNDFYLLLFATAVFGFGFSLCFPNLPKLVKENFPQRLAGTATGIYTMGIPLGSGLGIAFTKPLLATTGSWRNVLLIWSLIALPIIVLWWTVVLLSRRRKRHSNSKGAVRESTPHGGPIQPIHLPMEVSQVSDSSRSLLGLVLIAGILLSSLNLIFYCTLGWLPTYLSELGWEPAKAAAATSVISFMEIPAIILIPILSDRTGKRKLITILSFLVIAICSVAVALVPSWTWVVAPFLGITFGGVFVLILAMPVELVERNKVGRAAGAIISIGYVGALLSPPIIGYLRDLTGNFSLGFLMMALAGLVSAGLSFALPAARSYQAQS